ncbi:hypothetical protein XBKB1_460006 [Xenorhabdus bovienii str. kraussei Becker Underwood]|uniref:Uncharacterized protein n=1 Tax=Xenorhabdus bovienii str. kraussei Becker Underwood TaxID=1398204 RepID=A0A077PY93_XENBV|nr:hypothetical protein XBKB1_460006 [Xenorhabdus bovienii str. kraussei Becker Underwood]
MVENFYDGKNIQFWDELAKIHFDKSDYNIDSYDPQKYRSCIQSGEHHVI